MQKKYKLNNLKNLINEIDFKLLKDTLKKYNKVKFYLTSNNKNFIKRTGKNTYYYKKEFKYIGDINYILTSRFFGKDNTEKQAYINNLINYFKI